MVLRFAKNVIGRYISVRDSFVLYTSYMDQISLLNNEQRGVLLTAIYSYAMENELPDMDGMTKMAFSFIRSQLDKDMKKYDDVCRKRREAGKSGGRPKANDYTEKQEKAKKANGFSEKQTETKKPDNEYEYDNDNDLKENIKRKIFQPPTVEAVKAYCTERGNKVDPQSFVDFYESKGWMIGKNKMKDWKAAVRTWEKNETKTRQEGTAKLVKDNNNFDRRDYDMDELERRLIQ